MTDEERCEVAAELRELAEDYEKVPAWDVIAAGELPAPVDDVFMACGLGRAVHATEICGRLADLIEPEERTCRISATGIVDSLGRSMYRCSECGALMEDDAIFFEGVDEIDWFNYCPNCGAKVVEAWK